MRGDVRISDILLELERDDLLPAIVFRTSRMQCETDALRAGSNKRLYLSAPKQRELRLCIQDVMRRCEMDKDLITTHPQYNSLVHTGIGAHHAGQLLMWRLLLEEIMAAGQLRILVATGTVAAGVDFPARTVVITAHSRRGADGFRNFTSAEFQQMSGRAGRRGKDSVGFCIVAPTPFCDARELLKISHRHAEPLTSAYFPSPSTVLNLLRYRNVDDLRFTVQRSLASHMDRREARKLYSEADSLEGVLLSSLEPKDVDSDSIVSDGENSKRDEKRIRKKIKRLRRIASELENNQLSLIDLALNGLEKLGYVEKSCLSEKGYWAASLCTGLVLELGEIIECGMLDGVSAEHLVAVVASIAGDSHRKYLENKQGAVLAGEDISKLKEILDRVRSTEMPGLQLTREVVESAAYTVLVWMQAENWQQFRSVLVLSRVAEGDAARLITQTADHLNQLSRLSETHSALSYRAEEAKRRILRPPLSVAISIGV